ncbi:hypothetical protein GCM10023231_40410 [Olivibacter ginsenosidimutans]|uniref:Glycoside hydrolase family 32 protein n=1 Tax=Olivibacter ginsenosidimutans TaxID=1176537 RepID=A0ABP9CAU7_9SPHI
MKKNKWIKLAIMATLPMASTLALPAKPVILAGQKIVINDRNDAPVKTITAEKKWLLLPVKNGAPKQKIEIRVQGKPVRAFDIELAKGQPDWYAYLDISTWKGQQLEITSNDEKAVSADLDAIKQEDRELDAQQSYHEPNRGLFHFSPKRGWNNDPNGLVYYKGEYHLFFQHNPYGVQWGNMHWGHAVSKDLIHWTEVGEALYPDSYGTMFSGSGVVDVDNTSGLGTTSNPPMVVFYTAGEQSWTQGMAYSTDGRKFTKFDRPVVPNIKRDNRDPKVIWYAPGKHWVMVVWVPEANDQHSMHFLTSTNLKDWKEASVLKGGIGNDRYLFECPEFFELPVEGTQEKKWILTGANSQYAIGSFDGQTFVPEIERLNGQRGRDFYASQTYNNEPNGRRIEIGWWRTHTDGNGSKFNQSMSIPLELKLVQTPKGPRLSRTPIKELNNLRENHQNVSAVNLKNGQLFTAKGADAEALEIRTTLTPSNASSIHITVRGVDIFYNVAEQELSVDGVSARAELSDKGKLDLILYVDRTGLEIFADQGLLFMPINKNIPAENKGLTLKATGGDAQCDQLNVYTLKSIWP